MMRRKNGLLLVSLAALACSGRYEVGEMDAAGGGASVSGGSAGWSGAGGGDAAGQVSGGRPALGGAPTDCFSAVAPAPLNAPFVAPQVVWDRIVPFIWGEEEPVTTPQLPSETSYDWAGQLVDEAFAEAIAEAGGVPGGDFFVRRWLGLEGSAAVLEGDYGGRMAPDDTTLLDALLLTSWVPGRSGAFSEQAWLAKTTSIPGRGREMALNIFGVSIPAPPAGINLTVDSTLQDRAAIEAATSSASCAGCHHMFTPLGYSLGHFDHAGNYRDLDHDRPIDVTGSYQLANGVLNFDGIADLGAKAATTCDANLAIVDRFLDVALTLRGYDQESRYTAVESNRERVRRAFIVRGGSYHALVRAFAQSPLVLY